MKTARLLPFAAIVALFTLAACANTIRGAGEDIEDTAQTVEDVVE